MSACAARQLTQVHTWWVLCRHRHSQDMQTWGFPQDKCTGCSWKLVSFSKRRSSCHRNQQKGKGFLLSGLKMLKLPPVDGTGWDNPWQYRVWAISVYVCIPSPATAFPGITGSLRGKPTRCAFKAVALIIWHLLDTCHFHIWAESPFQASMFCFPLPLPDKLRLWEGGHLVASLLLLSSSTFPSFRDCNAESVLGEICDTVVFIED